MTCSLKASCPCHSGKTYGECCHPYHDGALPEHALQLMRSRYAAYVLQDLDYLIKTTDRMGPQYIEDHVVWKKQMYEFATQTEFENLIVLADEEKDDKAKVTFQAVLKRDEHDISFEEISFFKRVDGQWLYSECLELDFIES